MANPLLIAAAGVEIVGSVFSFLESKKEREKMKEAQAAAAKATAQAKKELSINYLKQLGIAKEAYEFEREALLSAGATGTAAGVAGDPRGAAATVGRVGMLLAQQAKEQRAAMAKEMAAFNAAIAKEDARLATARATIDLGEAAGAQAAAQDAALRAQYNLQQGISGVASGLSGLATSGLFDKKEEPEGVIPGEDMIGGTPPLLGVNLGEFQGYTLPAGITSSLQPTSLFTPRLGQGYTS